MRKRQKFVLTAFLLGLGLAVLQNFPLEVRYLLIGVLTVATWGLAVWSLREGLSNIEWLTVPLPPTLFTLGVGLFFILLPGFWIYRLLVLVFFGVIQYAALLAANIYSVAAIRTIALLRTAHTVGVVIMLLTAFLLFNTVFSFKLGFAEIGGLVCLISFGLYLPTLWSIKLEQRLSATVGWNSALLAIMCGFFGIMLSFWPMNISVAALFLATYMYMTAGVVQAAYADRLFKATIWEYVVWGGVVMITALVKTFF
jgi:hypothetical protein